MINNFNVILHIKISNILKEKLKMASIMGRENMATLLDLYLGAYLKTMSYKKVTNI